MTEIEALQARVTLLEVRLGITPEHAPQPEIEKPKRAQVFGEAELIALGKLKPVGDGFVMPDDAELHELFESTIAEFGPRLGGAEVQFERFASAFFFIAAVRRIDEVDSSRGVTNWLDISARHPRNHNLPQPRVADFVLAALAHKDVPVRLNSYLASSEFGLSEHVGRSPVGSPWAGQRRAAVEEKRFPHQDIPYRGEITIGGAKV